MSTTTSAQRAITIGSSAEELYRLWREPAVLAAVMSDVADVTSLEGNRSHWKAQDRNKQQVEWVTEIVEQRPGEQIRWSSPAGSELPTDGEVEFRAAPGDFGTEVRLRMSFSPPAGAKNVTLKNILGETPDLVAERALRRFKSLAETGEIPTTKQQPAARDDGRDT